MPAICSTVFAAARMSASDFVSANSYNNMYPAMNNKMRTSLNPGTTPSTSQDPVSAYTRVKSTDSRRVVARSAAGAAGVATTTARAASTGQSVAAQSTTAAAPQTRRVVQRASARQTATGRSGRADSSYIARASEAAANMSETSTESLPASRCLADYTECMNGYCQRENTNYNRCYCSAKLAQIDAQYQPAIDDLIKQLLTLGGTDAWTQAEMNEYWEQTVGQYTGDNSWLNLDSALDINWADTESRVRGQQAFATGHEYCVQHLRGCYYMAANMRDAYRSEIARDCSTYETNLQKIKNAAESIIENYQE
ncbi:MAG: hypothetical protein LBD50_03475 [Rickettsiales bacterium]|nr:hypothetical protein [Rickettsiales bacterium]